MVQLSPCKHSPRMQSYSCQGMDNIVRTILSMVRVTASTFRSCFVDNDGEACVAKTV